MNMEEYIAAKGTGLNVNENGSTERERNFSMARQLASPWSISKSFRRKVDKCILK